VSDLRVVGGRSRFEPLAALAEGRVIAVAVDGAYHLAALPDHRDAIVAARSRCSASLHEAPFQFMVGLRAQAMGLASAWSKETRILTDRMWPGPLTVVVRSAALASEGSVREVVRITMPASRAPRALSRACGPLALVALGHPDGEPFVAREEVSALFTGGDVALVVDGGTCRGPGPTVVDCTATPPVVCHVGVFPESFIDAALIMGNRRTRWRTKKAGLDAGSLP
jgi:tRNA A37 threonylcarbamoyladenosine synthetase subunit TsaC/SUA5/YrdC